MATSMVHVEYQSSDSGSEGDLEESDNDSDNVEDDKLQEKDTLVEDDKAQEKHGLADVMAKILHKNIPSHKQVILAKGQTDKEIRKRKLVAEETDKDKDKDDKKKEKTEPVEISDDIARREKKKLWEDMCHVKPNLLEREKERRLQRIATRGVVQLFNAVRKQQKTVEEEVLKAGSDRKKEKVMEHITKDKFLNMLKGSSVSNVNLDQQKDSQEKQKLEKKQSNEEREKKWNILRDDYMMGAKMKDWNKESSDDDNDDDPGDPELSDSD